MDFVYKKNESNEFRIEVLSNLVYNYLFRSTIGKGTFGKVKKATHITTQEPVAIKILQKNKIKDITDVERVTR